MNIRTKSDLINFLIVNKDKLKEHGVQRFGIFGSFARDEQRSESDIDLLVEFNPALKNFDNFMEVLFLIEDQTERKVDLVTPESLSPYIGSAILKEAEYYSI